MAEYSEIGTPYYLSTEKVICGHLEDFANITKDYFDNVAKLYNQRGRPVNNQEALKEIGKNLTSKAEQLKESINTALHQLEVHKEINKVKEEIQKVEKEIHQAHSQLKEAESILATAVFQAKKKLEAGKQAKSASVSCEELIKFAFRISSGNSVEAPPDWKPGDPRRPYPLDIEMRCGALGQLSQKNPPNTGKSDGTNDSLTRTVAWQGQASDDSSQLASLPVSAMMSNSNNVTNADNNEEVEFMSTSSDSSSSGDST